MPQLEALRAGIRSVCYVYNINPQERSTIYARYSENSSLIIEIPFPTTVVIFAERYASIRTRI